MVEHAVRCVPEEACGVFVAEKNSTAAHTFVPMRNAAESAKIYEFDPVELRRVEECCDNDGVEIIGVMHSHTHTLAYPSPTDVRDAAAFDPFGVWHYIIVSLKDAVPVMRSYRIVDGLITEEVLGGG